MLPSPRIVRLTTAELPYTYHRDEIVEWVSSYAQFPETERRIFARLAQAGGIEQRSSVLPDFGEGRGPAQLFTQAGYIPSTENRQAQYRIWAPQLARETLNQALAQQGWEAESLTHLLVVSCTGLMAPGLEITLTQELNLRPDVVRLGLNFIGCYAALPALRLARQWALTQPDARIAVVCVELCSLHYQASPEVDYMLANSLFADGAAVALVANEGAGWALEAFASRILPDSGQDMAWEPSSHGFLMRLSRYVPQVLQGAGLAELQHILQDWAVDASSADLRWAIHPGGRDIVDRLQESLSLSPQQTEISRQVLRQRGNMSAVTLLHVLAGQPKTVPGQELVALGFGPGLSLEVMKLAYSG